MVAKKEAKPGKRCPNCEQIVERPEYGSWAYIDAPHETLAGCLKAINIMIREGNLELEDKIITLIDKIDVLESDLCMVRSTVDSMNQK